MPKKKTIPINAMDEYTGTGIAIEKMSINKADFTTPEQIEKATQSHRDEGHTFHIVEKGTVNIEIDFKKYSITAPCVVYMHPNQVHRILDISTITVCTLAVKNENLHPLYLEKLEQIAPAKPQPLTKQAKSTIADAFALSLSFAGQRDNKIYHLLLKDSCNVLVGCLITELLRQHRSASGFSRAELVTKSFRQLLEKNYCNNKRPVDYARLLNISAAYLNECVKNTTGSPVSVHIQDRVILEAKRLLCHTDKSVKEISFELGYTDYPYFSRVFMKATGMSALHFRTKNRD